ncbi:MAG: hypothetical protein ABGY11_02740 [Candidatus Thioglobus sp.]
MNKEFIMRGQTASGQTEILNFTGHTPGYAYRLVEFQLFPSTAIGTANNELVGTITAGKTAVAPTDPNFTDPGLIATNYTVIAPVQYPSPLAYSVVNDTFLITQDLILMVQDAGSGGYSVNWQCRFVAEKLNSGEEAVANFKQFTIFDG